MTSQVQGSFVAGLHAPQEQRVTGAALLTCKAARSSVLVVSDHTRPAWLWSRNRAVQNASQLLFRVTLAAQAADACQQLRPGLDLYRHSDCAEGLVIAHAVDGG